VESAWDEVAGAFYRHLIAVGKTEATAQSYVAHFRVFYFWCHRREVAPADAAREAVERFIAEQRQRVRPNTVNMRFASVRAFYGFLGLDERDRPTQALQPKREEVLPFRPCTDAELAALFAACRSKRDLALIRIALVCGLRVSEVVGLQPAEVDEARGLIVIHGKGARQRLVAVDCATLDLIRQFLPWRMKDGRPLTLKAAHQVMEEIARRAGVRGHWHRLRTTFATRFLEATGDLDALQTILGHRDANTTRRYTYWVRENRALDQMRRFQAL